MVANERSAATARMAVAGFFLLAALYLYHVAGGYARYASQGQIGPNVWPQIVLALMALAAAAELLASARALRRAAGSITVGQAAAEATTEPVREPGGGSFAVALCALLVVAYVVALPYVGFLIASVLLLPLVLLAAGYRRIEGILAMAIVVPIVLSYVFERLLSVVFPIGLGPFEEFTKAVYHTLHIF
ncbi:MAG: tripartite tricarboxylate transporter TctB family protein [bacterium]|nr:tripartite tricarboxylate transporter TctB family protein [bacterium]